MSNPGELEARVFAYYPPLRKAKEYVERNLSEPIPLRAAAQAAGMEEKYFSAFFHRKTGICFRDWLSGRRVGRAIEILQGGDDTITRVAASVGFQDLRTFERAFKRCTGLTPRDFKRSVAPEALSPRAVELPVIAFPVRRKDAAPAPVAAVPAAPSSEAAREHPIPQPEARPRAENPERQASHGEPSRARKLRHDPPRQRARLARRRRKIGHSKPLAAPSEELILAGLPPAPPPVLAPWRIQALA